MNARLSMLTKIPPPMLRADNEALERGSPYGLLQHYAISVSVLIAASARTPVRIEGADCLKSSGIHPLTRESPLLVRPVVKNQEILGGWARCNRVPPTARELEVIVCFRQTDHDPIEIIMVFEA